MLILETLEKSLETLQMPSEYYDQIASLSNVIMQTKEELKKQELDLAHAIDSLYAELAKEIRKQQPKLLVSIRTNGCEVGYRTRAILCNMEPFGKKWNFGLTPFGVVFQKRYPQCKQLSCSLKELAETIVEFFKNNFRSLV
jgi:hypothetical protein